MTVTPSLLMCLATERRARALKYGPSTPPHTNVTAWPSSASSVAVSIPVGPAPTTTTGRSGLHLAQLRAQRLGVLQFRYGVGEFGRAGHRQRGPVLPTA